MPAVRNVQDTTRFQLALLALFAASGAAGLVYQVAWVRQLTTVVGASAHAVTAVLATFMLGLGLGAWLLGKVADRLSAAGLVRAYVLLEVGIGVYALALPLLLGWAEAAYIAFYRATGSGGVTSNGGRLLLCSALLVFPTTCMGATLPVLSRYLIRNRSQIALGLSRLYAANTLGAIAGTLAAGFLLLPRLGVAGTTWLAASVNFAVAAAFWALYQGTAPASTAASAPPVGVQNEPLPAPTGLRWAVLLGFGVSGATAMIYEVTWTRTLSMILGTTTFAFTTMLATFLLGIALGSALYGLVPASVGRARLFATLQLLVGLTALGTIPLFEKLPVLYLSLHALLVESWFDVQLLRFALGSLVILVPTVALGAMFQVVGKAWPRATSSAPSTSSAATRSATWSSP